MKEEEEKKQYKTRNLLIEKIPFLRYFLCAI